MLSSEALIADRPAARLRPHCAAALTGGILLVVALAAAASVDVVRDGYGIKSDEATYVSMALSAAFDGDLAYERRDLERFFGLYRSGPDGIFLKRGKRVRVLVDGAPPFIHLQKTPDLRANRLYFAKSMLYPLAAAPFLRMLGLNGLLVFNVLLLFAAGAAFYAFLAARSPSGPALTFALAFVFASCVPVYLVLLTPEIFNFALVSVAYCLWLYKEVAPPGGWGWLRSRGSDVAAAILLGLATYSKPSHALLVAPPVLWAWWRRRLAHGLLIGLAGAASAALLFVGTAAVTGEFNFQGGDRKTFYGSFPFDGSAENAWDRAKEMSTNDSDAGTVFTEFWPRFAHNAAYFVAGRHFGFVPYFFPGALATAWWLASAERRTPWRLMVAGAMAATAVGLLMFFPFTWSGGGGPPGNRYFMSVYPLAIFLLPPLRSSMGGVAAWIVGALFTAKMVVSPFYAAKNPHLNAERGFARWLPVEVTMANDLPIALDVARSHVWFSDVLLSFLDKHSYTPEVVNAAGDRGIWIAGDGRADIVVRSEWPIDHLTVTAESPIATVFWMSLGSRRVTVALAPGRPSTFDVPASGVRGLNSYAYLLSARSSEGFVPHLRTPASNDFRNLGVMIRFRAVPAAVPR